jgi:hypothetical protein
MSIPNEDCTRDMYDRVTTHNDPHSLYYDGPDGDEPEDEEEAQQ